MFLPSDWLINVVTWSVNAGGFPNLVPRVFSLSNMAAAGEKTQRREKTPHSRNHMTDLSTDLGLKLKSYL